MSTALADLFATLSESGAERLVDRDEEHVWTPRELFTEACADARRSLRRLREPPLDEVNEFPDSVQELRRRLRTDDAEVAAGILLEAEQISNRMVESRVESVERRAATLQGVVAIASTLVLTGGTLVVSQIRGAEWRGIGGLLLLLCIGSFAMCGQRATQAASQWRRWHTPRRNDVFCRPGQHLAEIRIARAAALLRSAGANSSVARWKVTMLRKSVRHLQRALLLLALLALWIFVYALLEPVATDGGEPKRDRVTTLPLESYSLASRG